MKNNIDKSQWASIIKSVKGPISFYALVILCFQAILLSIVYKSNENNITMGLVLTSAILIMPPWPSVSVALPDTPYYQVTTQIGPYA